MAIPLIILTIFTIGLQQISYKIYSSLFKSNGLDKKNSIYSLGIIISFISILNFSSFVNFILIAPSIFFKKFNSSLTNIIFNISENILIICLFIILIFGIISIFKLCHIFINKKYGMIDDFKIKSLLILLGSLFVSCLIYAALAPKDINTGIAYDTGLYHLPYVNHINSFGIEKGLASLQWNYGFYSIQFFAQSIFQKLYNNPNFLSPSLNIVFFALYISYFVSNFFIFPKDYFSNKKEPKYIYSHSFFKIFSIIYFFSSILLTSEGLLISLSSYTQNLGIFCCGSIICFIFLSSTFVKVNKFESISVILLTFYAPLFKGSGMIVGFLALLIFIFHTLYSRNQKLIYKFIKTNNFLINRNYLIFASLIIFSYLIAFLTNTLTAGYPIYPSPLIGPFGSHAIDKIHVINAKNLIINLARFGPNYVQSEHLFINTNKLIYWLPFFLKTRNGLYFIFSSILPTLLSILVSLFHPKEKFENQKINLLIFSTCLFLIESICMLFLVPELRYYTWFAPVSMFLLFYSTIYLINFKKEKLLKMGLLIYSLFLILYLFLIWPLSMSNSIIFKNIPSSFFRKPVLTKVETELYEIPITKWQPQESKFDQKKIIKVPVNSDQCWGSENPCTPYVLNGIPLTIRRMYKE